MNNASYHSQLDTIVTNTLLHLYTQVAQEKRHVPVSKRDSLIIRYLKPKIKDKRFEAARKDIKSLLLAARKIGNVERKLIDLNEKIVAHQQTFTHADQLYRLLTELYEDHGLESRIAHEDKILESDVIYVEASEIETGFNDDSEQIRPLKFYMQTDCPETIVSHINQSKLGKHTVDIDYTEDNVTHYLLTLNAK